MIVFLLDESSDERLRLVTPKKHRPVNPDHTGEASRGKGHESANVGLYHRDTGDHFLSSLLTNGRGVESSMLI
jgi:hypothetical protein